ncbi:MAG: hypothetical protein HDS22_04015 [Bacteroides sp.]|nr:hypothetical protein [Bacteroides sp.]
MENPFCEGFPLSFSVKIRGVNNKLTCFVHVFNNDKYILTFIDLGKGQDIAHGFWDKCGECDKNICTTAKTVVILHPQSGRQRHPG